jgi:16S rRNA processing protein RimM
MINESLSLLKKTETLSDLVPLGKCLKPHGLKGGVHLYLYGNNPKESCLRKGLILQVCIEDTFYSLTVEDVSLGHRSYIRFLEWNHVDCWNGLLPLELLIPRSQLPGTEEGEYYLHDFYSYSLKLFHDPDGPIVGKIKDFYENGKQIIFCLELLENYRSPYHPIMELPFVEAYFPRIDEDKQLIYINIPQFMSAQ